MSQATRIIYEDVGEGGFFALLGNSVNRTVELCGIRPYVTWGIVIYNPTRSWIG